MYLTLLMCYKNIQKLQKLLCSSFIQKLEKVDLSTRSLHPGKAVHIFKNAKLLDIGTSKVDNPSRGNPANIPIVNLLDQSLKSIRIFSVLITVYNRNKNGKRGRKLETPLKVDPWH